MSKRFLIVLLITLTALSLRLRTALYNPWTFDEHVYIRVADNYARWIDEGAYERLFTARQNYMHPVLAKYLFAASVLLTGSTDDPERSRIVIRLLSVAFGTACVTLLAWMNPFAGLALALHNIPVKFNGLAYLDSIPMLFSFLAVWCYQKSGRRLSPWLYASALAAAAALASKYAFVMTIVALGWFVLRNSEDRARASFRFAVVFLTAFLLLNPVWWARSAPEVAGSFLFHYDYGKSDYVAGTFFPWYQPLVYLFDLKRLVLEPPRLVNLDILIFVCGLCGLGLLWKRERIYAVWLALATGFLLVWPTKWSHYPLILMVPFCLSGGLFAEYLVQVMSGKRRAVPALLRRRPLSEPLSGRAHGGEAAPKRPADGE